MDKVLYKNYCIIIIIRFCKISYKNHTNSYILRFLLYLWTIIHLLFILEIFTYFLFFTHKIIGS